MQAEQQIQRIHQKLQQLLKQQLALQKHNRDLTQQLMDLKRERSQYQGIIDELQQQLEILKAAKSELTADEKKAFDKRLSQFIKEIDRCMTILGE